jgi:hypothetical protein
MLITGLLYLKTEVEIESSEGFQMFPYSVMLWRHNNLHCFPTRFSILKKSQVRTFQRSKLDWIKDDIAINVFKRQFNLNVIFNFCTNTPPPHITQGLLSPIGPEHCLSSLPDWLGPGGNNAWRSSIRVSNIFPIF